MDLTKLTIDELVSSLKLINISTVENDVYVQAYKNFIKNKNATMPTPIVDLYIASKLIVDQKTNFLLKIEVDDLSTPDFLDLCKHLFLPSEYDDVSFNRFRARRIIRIMQSIPQQSHFYYLK